jgi:hypothetical protein
LAPHGANGGTAVIVRAFGISAPTIHVGGHRVFVINGVIICAPRLFHFHPAAAMPF